MTLRRFLVAGAMASSVGITVAADWPTFRGPDGTGSVSASKLPTEWSVDQNIAWKVTVPGVAWSCPIVIGDNVFVTTAFAEGQPKPRSGGGFGGGGRPPGAGGGQPPGGGQRPPGAGGQPPGGGGRPGGGRGAGPDKVYTWKVVCLDKATGKVKWEQVASEGKPKYATQQSNTFASETPTSDGERVYAYFGATGTVVAYDLAGKQVWKIELGAFPSQMGFGTSSSPTAYNGLVYVQCDNEEKSFLVALDAKTGEEKWKVDRAEKTNWSTPYIWKQKDRTDLVVGGSQKMRGYDPATGKLIWELSIGGGQSNASPVGTAEMLYVGTGGMGGGGGFGRPGGGGPPGAGGPPGGAGGQPPASAGQPPGGQRPGGGQGGRGGMGGGANAGTLFAIKAGVTGDITPKMGKTTSDGIAWSAPRATPAAATPLVYNGYVYCLARNGGMISCFDAKTGKQAYKDERIPQAKAFWASPWAYDGKIFALDEDGVTHVLKAGPEFEVLRANKLGKDMYWSSPALVDGMVVMRGIDSIVGIK
jgi:outer membrane protein assembly factor BamB